MPPHGMSETLSKHRLQLPYAAPHDTAARMPNQPKIDIRVFNRFGDFFSTSCRWVEKLERFASVPSKWIGGSCGLMAVVHKLWVDGSVPKHIWASQVIAGMRTLFVTYFQMKKLASTHVEQGCSFPLFPRFRSMSCLMICAQRLIVAWPRVMSRAAIPLSSLRVSAAGFFQKLACSFFVLPISRPYAYFGVKVCCL